MTLHSSGVSVYRILGHTEILGHTLDTSVGTLSVIPNKLNTVLTIEAVLQFFETSKS